MRPGAVLAELGKSDLSSLSVALRSGRLAPPFSSASISRITGPKIAPSVVDALHVLVNRGLEINGLALCLELIVESLDHKSSLEDAAQLVMTAPTESGAYHRDTRVVVTDLFRRAQHSVTVAGYAVYQGKKIFEGLAMRMDAIPSLRVRLFLNMTARPEDPSPSASIARFVKEFRAFHWPEDHRLPEIFYDRRAIESRGGASIAFHAKCVVLDAKELFVSSANFTEAAQNRNIELGIMLESPTLATQTERFFSDLIADGVCERAV